MWAPQWLAQLICSKKSLISPFILPNFSPGFKKKASTGNFCVLFECVPQLLSVSSSYLPQSKDMRGLRFIGDSKFAVDGNSCLSHKLCDTLATCPGSTLPFAQCHPAPLQP